MPLPGTSVVPIEFSGGINSGTDAFTLDQPYLAQCENGVFNQLGRIDKRTGFQTIGTNLQGGGNINKGLAVTTFNDELLMFDGKQLYSWQEEQQVWISRGNAFSTTNDQVRILNTKAATQSNPDASTCGDLTLYAWEDNRAFPLKSNGIRYSIINNKTGTIIISDDLLYLAGARPKVINDGATFYVLYEASSDTILYNTIPVDRPSLVSSTFNTITRDGYSSNPNTLPSIPYDAVIYQGNILATYAEPDGPHISINDHLLDARPNINAIGMCVDSLDQVWVAYSDNINTYITCFKGIFGGVETILFPIVINAFQTEVSVNLALIEQVNSPGSCNLCCEIDAGANNHFFNNYVVSTKGVSTFIGQQRGVGLASKPFSFGGNIFINSIYSSALQSTYFTHCLTQGAQFSSGTAEIQAANNAALATSFAIVSKHSPTNGGTYRTNSILSQCEIISNGAFVFAGQRKGPFTSFQNAQTVNFGVAGYSIQFNSINAFNAVSANNNLHIVGGVKKIYDGVSCVEDNFNVFPENSDGYGCTPTINPGEFQPGLNYVPNSPNLYQYIVVYEWSDNYGQIQRSGASVAVPFNTTAPFQESKLVGPTLRLTEKVAPRSPVVISIYRNQINSSIFYKITNDLNPLINDPTVDTWTYFDRAPDSDIIENETLYTFQQLSNTAPPPCSLISLNQQRVMINSTEDPGVLWFTQNKFEQDQYNTLALDFNTSFVEGVDSTEGNEITAIGRLDQNLVIFKKTSLFLLQGDGPNALDTAGQFNDAQLIVADTGCDNQNSLCFITQTPQLPGGLLFKSPKGIYLFGRDESIIYIGKPVEQYNNLTITSANLLSKSNQVVFTTLEGRALVYNYFYNSWTTWVDLPAVAATVWNDQLVILNPNGTAMVQDITNTLFEDIYANDVHYPISLTIQTPWIRNGVQQGYQSIFACYLLGLLQDEHTLSINVAYDYNPSIGGEVLVSSTLASNRWGGLSIWGSKGSWGNASAFSNYQFQININNTLCQSLQITISDINPNGTQGYSLNGLALEIMPIGGPPRLPAANKVALR